MKRTGAIMSFKLKLGLLETKSAEENKSVLDLQERWLLKVIRHMLYVKMLITSNMSLLSLERRKHMIKMILTDWEMELPWKKESVKIMTPELRVLIMTSTKLKKDQMSCQSYVMQKNSNLEELEKLLIVQLQNWLEARMITQDSWLKHKLFKEI